MKKQQNKTTPKTVYFAVFILLLIVAFVSINTFTLLRTLKGLEAKCLSTPLEIEAFSVVYEDFLSVRTYLSLSVAHDDIGTLEREFVEILGALKIGDKESAAIAKSRLCGTLSHLGRLSGFNIDSII